LLNEVRQRNYIEWAHRIPDAVQPEEDMPDPFAAHQLLHHPIYERGAVFSCTRNDGTAEYVVESAPYEPWWKVKTPENHEVCRVKAERMWSGLLFNAGLPHRLVVYKGTEPRAEIRHRPGLTTPRTEIEAYSDRRTYHVRQGAIFYGGQLVGRLYYARQAFHLDIHQDHFNEGTLGYFVTLT